MYIAKLQILKHYITVGDPASTSHRLHNFCETFLSMDILPDLIWWLQPELASKTPKIKK